MENYIPISFLNDFIFCPRSIYFHQLYNTFDKSIFIQSPQIKGLTAHKTIDEKTYSTSKHILTSFDVYSEKYKLLGKIDVFDIKKGKLIERKRQIKQIYDGYIFQVYAHYFCLIEMGFSVNHLVIHDLIHNKNYDIPLPHQSEKYFNKFEKLIEDINNYDLSDNSFLPLLSKCQNCIYNQLCDQSLC